MIGCKRCYPPFVASADCGCIAHCGLRSCTGNPRLPRAQFAARPIPTPPRGAPVGTWGGAR